MLNDTETGYFKYRPGRSHPLLEWNEIPQNSLARLYDKMTRRVDALIRARTCPKNIKKLVNYLIHRQIWE